ncbi:hypothetical protein HanXRQr2_Chr08g0329861 [Helianthus annuus]|uniref:Uncharacterized protein n=1 Tax=Helianthus annuus TaxID=4232 RepID=A0A9K3ID09_HELAN|nr:hypothetical protein HanXRQr2_Chr08g0329861 [Helianthus annuus]KAJ0900899.1 hypothetical protein HanPSC8_Chr08g0318991 [Helianthus annuus]
MKSTATWSALCLRRDLWLWLIDPSLVSTLSAGTYGHDIEQIIRM